jgi:hypothetical protein
MIHQDIEQLKAETNRTGIVIQDQIIHYYLESSNTIATQAALIGGFAFNAYGFHDDWSGIPTIHRMIFVNALCAATSFCMMAVILSTHCCIQAPGLQLLGPEGSTQRACDLLRRWHGYTLWAFNLGLGFFLIALIDIGFTLSLTENDAMTLAMTMVAQIGGMMVIICYCVNLIHSEFTFETDVVLGPTDEGFSNARYDSKLQISQGGEDDMASFLAADGKSNPYDESQVPYAALVDNVPQKNFSAASTKSENRLSKSSHPSASSVQVSVHPNPDHITDQSNESVDAVSDRISTGANDDDSLLPTTSSSANTKGRKKLGKKMSLFGRRKKKEQETRDQ